MIQSLQHDVSNNLWLYTQSRGEMGDVAALSFQAYSASLAIEQRLATITQEVVNANPVDP